MSRSLSNNSVLLYLQMHCILDFGPIIFNLQKGARTPKILSSYSFGSDTSNASFHNPILRFVNITLLPVAGEVERARA